VQGSRRCIRDEGCCASNIPHPERMPKFPETSVINSLRSNPEERCFNFHNSAYLTKVLCVLVKEHTDLFNVVFRETGPCNVACDVRNKERVLLDDSRVSLITEDYRTA